MSLLSGAEQRHRLLSGVVAFFSGAVLLVLLWAVHDVGPGSAGLGKAVAAAMPQSGVSHPVTAVLLNFRGYDTLLELAVLVLVLMGVWANTTQTVAVDMEAASPMLQSFARVVVPLMVLVAGYLLWVGSRAPGGAFQSGAVLGAAGVLVLLADLPLRLPLDGARRVVRFWAVLAVATFLSVGVSGMLSGGTLLQYPPEHAGALIFAIELAASFSIAVALVVFFAYMRSVRS